MGHPERGQIWRKIAVFLAVATIAGALFGGLRLLAALTPSRERLVQALHSGLGVNARVGRVQFDWAKLAIVARRVEVVDAAGQPLLSALELRLHPSLKMLFSGELDLRSMQISGAVLTLNMGPGAASASVLHPRGGAWPFKRLSIRDAKVRVDAASRLTLDLAHASIELRAESSGLGIEVKTTSATLTSDGRHDNLARAELKGTLGASALRIERALLQGPSIRLDVRRATLARPLGSTADADVELDVDVARLVPMLRGRMHATGHVAGSAQQVTGKGKLSVDSLEVGGLALRDRVDIAWSAQRGVLALSSTFSAAPDSPPIAVSTQARIATGAIVFDDLRVQHAATTLQGSGRIGADQTLNMSLVGNDVQLSDLPQLASTGLTGHGRVDVHAGGLPSAPEVRVELAVQDAAFHKLALGTLTAAFSMSEDAKLWTFTLLESGNVTRKLSAEHLSLRFRDNRIVSATGKLRVDRLALAELYGLLGADSQSVLAHLQGEGHGGIDLDCATVDARTGLDLRLALDLRQPSFGGYRFDAGRLVAKLSVPALFRGLSPTTLAVESLSLEADGGKLLLSGGIEQDGKLALHATIEALPLERLGWLHERTASLTGHAVGQATVGGTMSVPVLDLQLALADLRIAGQPFGRARLHAELVGKEPSGRIVVQDLALGQGELAVASRAPFEVSVLRSAIALAGVPLQGPKLSFALGADGSLTDGVRVFVDGTAPANLLAKLNPLITAFGELALHLELRPDAHPWLRGHAEPRDVLVEVVRGGRTSKLQGSASLQGDRVHFDHVTLGLGGGTLGLSGEVVLDGLHIGSYDLQLHAQGVALEVQPHFELAFDADGRLQSSRAAAIPVLSGTLKLHRFYYSRHIPLPEALTAMNRDERKDRAAYASARDRVQLDLAIEHDAPLLVRNNLLDAELAASGPERRLHVVGTDQRFGLLGKLAVTRGRVLYRGDEFQITRGDITFNDPKRIDPSFDVRAVAAGRKRPDSSVVFSARGDRDAFDLDVRCENADVAVPPPPFSCDYKNDNLRCDSFEQLVALWVCRAGSKVSRADRAGADGEAR